MLRIAQVPEYLEVHYGVMRSVATIYIWIKKGMLVNDKRVKLKVAKDNLGQIFTRKEWIDRFVERVND